MSSDTWFTLVWGTASVLIGVAGGTVIYKRAKQAEELKQHNKKEQ